MGRYAQFPYRSRRENQNGDIRDNIEDPYSRDHCSLVKTVTDRLLFENRVPDLLARVAQEDVDEKIGNVEQEVGDYDSPSAEPQCAIDGTVWCKYTEVLQQDSHLDKHNADRINNFGNV
jgi:hypothetical protein